jgi:DNA-directed RNA polymerase alpha subunit
MMTLGDILKYDEATLLKVRNFGQTSLNEIKKKLATYNLSLKNE